MNISKSKMRKGITDITIVVILGLITIGMCVLLYILVEIKFLEIHTMVEEYGVERQVLNMAQVLLSYDKLVYIKDRGTTKSLIYRGVFEKESLDRQFRLDSDLTKEIGYPNALILLYVKDFENQNEWIHVYMGPFNPESRLQLAHWQCLQSKSKGISWTDAFRLPRGTPWGMWDATECQSSSISNYGSAVRNFPIIIKNKGEMHPGILKVAIDGRW